MSVCWFVSWLSGSSVSFSFWRAVSHKSLKEKLHSICSYRSTCLVLTWIQQFLYEYPKRKIHNSRTSKKTNKIINVSYLTKKSKNDSNQQITLADKAKFSFGFGLILAILRRFFANLHSCLPHNDCNQLPEYRLFSIYDAYTNIHSYLGLGEGEELIRSGHYIFVYIIYCTYILYISYFLTRANPKLN